jgi:hypothetical protein
MKTNELANILNGREYGNEIASDEIEQAKQNNLVVVFGYSDDNMELRGAINDEIGCYDGGYTFVTSSGLLENKCDCDECPYFEKEKKGAQEIIAKWDVEGYSWVYETNIPHATFDIYENGELYCRGIVFSLDDVAVQS